MKDKNDNDTVKVMIGSGEHSTFVNVKKGQKVMIGGGDYSMFITAGLTPEESRKRLDEKWDRVMKESKELEKKERKEQVKKRVLSLFNKNN